MTTLQFSDPELVPVNLQLVDRPTLGAAKSPPRQQLERISIGRPTIQRLDRSTLDTDTWRSLEQAPNSTFWLLLLTCSFRAISSAPFETSWLQLTLQTLRPAGAIEPIALSMEPETFSDDVQLSKEIKLDASLKLKSPHIPLEVGPRIAGKTTKTITRHEPYVRAHGERTAKPSWMFYRTASIEIGGIHRLRTVVEMPAEAVGQAEISAGATLRLKALGLIPYRADLNELPEQRLVQIG
jgi:hypothetical protein